MKRRRIAATLLALVLALQLSPLAYASTLDIQDATGEAGEASWTLSGEDNSSVASQPAPDIALNQDTMQAAPDPAISSAADQATILAAEVSITLKVTGLAVVGGFIEDADWATDENLTIGSSTNALDATLTFLNNRGITYTTAYSNTMLDSITSGGVTLGSANLGSVYSYWEFYVNGESSWDGAAATYPTEGVVWEWRYNDAAQLAFSERAFEVSIIGVEKVGGANTYVPWLKAAKYYDTSANALVAICAVLDRYGLAYVLAGEGSGSYLDSITNANGSVTLAMTSSGGNWSYWEFLVNGLSSWDGAYGTQPQPGDKLEFKYSLSGEDAPVEVVVNPDAPRPSYSADNAGFTTNRTVTSQTPTATSTTELAFKSTLKASDDWATGYSDLLLVNGNLYVAVGQKLVIYDGGTGVKLAETQLAHSVGYTSRPLYTQGLIVVPLDGGRLQAFTADTLTCVWITEVLPTENGTHQSNSTLIEQDGRLYFGTAVADWSTSFAGAFLCIDVNTGTMLWQFDNATSGYYWAGAVVLGEYVYIADDAGNVTSFSATGGWTADRINLGASVRSTLISDGSFLYAMDYAGTLWRIALGDWGTMHVDNSLKLAAASASSPVISGDKLYVGGTAADFTGTLAVVGVASFTQERSVSVPAQVQSAPLVVRQGGETYVYFTCNTTPGGLYCYRLGDAAATQIYIPTGDDANYCLSTVVASADGTLYYANDSGQLFALRASGTVEEPKEEGGSKDPEGGERSEEPGVPSPAANTGIAVGRVLASTIDATTTVAVESTQAEENRSNPAASSNRSATSSSAVSPADAVPLEASQPAETNLSLFPIVGIAVAVLGLIAAGAWYRVSLKGARTKGKL
ncbi:MAG: PQQ-binding-like beta-propeller repeat protein [Coriobacteriales bacterium]|jgi:outer membrane protein assembly factor BamB|nr:PQQ-binding-like beta-propeller repeat protein [Coriobacteriales bacterium]